jgi:hypothetical protein
MPQPPGSHLRPRHPTNLPPAITATVPPVRSQPLWRQPQDKQGQMKRHPRPPQLSQGQINIGPRPSPAHRRVGTWRWVTVAPTRMCRSTRQTDRLRRERTRSAGLPLGPECPTWRVSLATTAMTVGSSPRSKRRRRRRCSAPTR